MFQKGFSSMINRIKTVAVRFANDERGEAVQSVMGIAVAGMICILIMKLVGVNANGNATGSGFGEGIANLVTNIIGSKLPGF